MKLDSRTDLLMELVAHPGWRVLLGEVEAHKKYLFDSLLLESKTEFDLVKKESVTASIANLDRFFRGVSDKVERYARQGT